MFSNLCAGPSALNFVDIPMIFCAHIPWVVPDCSAKFGPNCLRFGKMAVILNRKNYIFASFFQSTLVIAMKLGRDMARGKGLDIGKWWPFLGSEIAFFNFFAIFLDK